MGKRETDFKDLPFREFCLILKIWNRYASVSSLAGHLLYAPIPLIHFTFATLHLRVPQREHDKSQRNQTNYWLLILHVLAFFRHCTGFRTLCMFCRYRSIVGGPDLSDQYGILIKWLYHTKYVYSIHLSVCARAIQLYNPTAVSKGCNIPAF